MDTSTKYINKFFLRSKVQNSVTVLNIIHYMFKIKTKRTIRVGITIKIKTVPELAEKEGGAEAFRKGAGEHNFLTVQV